MVSRGETGRKSGHRDRVEVGDTLLLQQELGLAAFDGDGADDNAAACPREREASPSRMPAGPANRVGMMGQLLHVRAVRRHDPACQLPLRCETKEIRLRSGDQKACPLRGFETVRRVTGVSSILAGLRLSMPEPMSATVTETATPR